MRRHQLGADRLGHHLHRLRPADRDHRLTGRAGQSRTGRRFRDGFEAGLSAIDEVADDPRLAHSGTAASIRADLLRRAGRVDEAARWYRIALNHNGSAPAREFLQRRLGECGQS
jgi:hypothetical protein